MWHYADAGSGPPLILLHGIGMSHAVWNPVTPYLSATRRVIAFDIAGFGRTPPLPAGTPPRISNLVEALERSIREIGIELPVDIAGSSLGGLIALEAARRGIARSVVAISPPCLWEKHGAIHVQYLFASLRFIARNAPALLKATMRIPLLRELALAVPISTGCRHMPVSDALRVVANLAGAAAFEETFRQTRSSFRATGITVPVTVAFGNRDWILPKRSRCRANLSTNTRWIEKKGWGHVPMWIDPAGVSDLILDGTHK